MTLREYMRFVGRWDGCGVRVHCPDPGHRDADPSAILNANSVYCFGCGRHFGLGWFRRVFGVALDEDVGGGNGVVANLGRLDGGGGMLFRYNFSGEELSFI